MHPVVLTTLGDMRRPVPISLRSFPVVGVLLLATAIAACSGDGDAMPEEALAPVGATEAPTSTATSISTPHQSSVPTEEPAADPSVDSDSFPSLNDRIEMDETVEPASSPSEGRPDNSSTTLALPLNYSPFLPRPWQHLQVIGPGGCIDMRAEPFFKAKVLKCIPLGEYVSLDYPPTVMTGRDGVTWRRVEHYYQRGFIDDRYLLGNEAYLPSKADWLLEIPSGVYDVDFPDVDLLYELGRRSFVTSYDVPAGELGRIYRDSDGKVRRGTLLTLEDLMAAHPDAFGELLAQAEEPADMGFLQHRGFVASPDGSHVYASVCTSAYRDGEAYGSKGRLEGWPSYCSEVVGVFHSADRGVTWRYLGSVDPIGPERKWHIVGVLPVDGGSSQLVIDSGSDVVLFPSGKIHAVWDGPLPWVMEGPRHRFPSLLTHLLHDGRVAWALPYMEAGFQWWASDGEALVSEEDLPNTLLLHALPEVEIPTSLYRHYLPGDPPPIGHDPPPDFESCSIGLQHCGYLYYLEYFTVISVTEP